MLFLLETQVSLSLTCITEHVRMLFKYQFFNWENYTVGKLKVMTETIVHEKWNKNSSERENNKISTYIHRPYTYLRQNIMKLILLLPLRLEMHSILATFSSSSLFAHSLVHSMYCYAKNAHFYNLFIASAALFTIQLNT